MFNSRDFDAENRGETLLASLLRTIKNIQHLENEQRAAYEKIGERTLEVERREKAASKTENAYKAGLNRLKKEKEEFDLHSQLNDALQEMNALKEEIIEKQASESNILRQKDLEIEAVKNELEMLKASAKAASGELARERSASAKADSKIAELTAALGIYKADAEKAVAALHRKIGEVAYTAGATKEKVSAAEGGRVKAEEETRQLRMALLGKDKALSAAEAEIDGLKNADRTDETLGLKFSSLSIEVKSAIQQLKTRTDERSSREVALQNQVAAASADLADVKMELERSKTTLQEMSTAHTLAVTALASTSTDLVAAKKELEGATSTLQNRALAYGEALSKLAALSRSLADTEKRLSDEHEKLTMKEATCTELSELLQKNDLAYAVAATNLASANDRIKELVGELVTAKHNVQQFSTTYATLNSNLNSKTESLRGQLDIAKTSLTAAETQLKATESTVTKMDAQITTAQTQVEDARAKVSVLHTKLASANSNLTNANATINNLRSLTTKLKVEKSVLESELLSANNTLHEQGNAIARANKSSGSHELSTSIARTQLEIPLEQNKKLETLVSEGKCKLVEKEEMLREKGEALVARDGELKSAKSTASRLQDQIAECEGQISSKAVELACLGEELTAMKQTSDQFRLENSATTATAKAELAAANARILELQETITTLQCEGLARTAELATTTTLLQTAKEGVTQLKTDLAAASQAALAHQSNSAASAALLAASNIQLQHLNNDLVSLRSDLGQKQSTLDIAETKAAVATESLERGEAREIELRSAIEAKEAETERLSGEIDDLHETLIRFQLLLARRNMLKPPVPVAGTKRPSPNGQRGSAGKKAKKT